ncbi:MAG: aldehyde-activating protein [Alphaproteobacteria bacterium]|nr:MAG: aldehyde-activating protein [Alphaproteobacteria bacterium]
MSEAAFHDGGCLCGAVRFRARGESLGVNHCHCRMCQRATGQPSVVWAAFEAASFQVLQGTIQEYASSSWATRGFCARCGSALTFHYVDEGRPMVDVTVASFDQPEAFPPTKHLWTESAVPWLAGMDTHLPRFAKSSGGTPTS